MRKLIASILIVAVSALAGCVSGAERAAEADADLKEERLVILQQYKDCVDEHKGDEKMLKSCEHYLMAIESTR